MEREIEKQLIECNKAFAEMVKRQQASLMAVSMLKIDEPSMLGHLRDAVYSFYRPYFERNSIEQGILEKLLAAQQGRAPDAAIASDNPK